MSDLPRLLFCCFDVIPGPSATSRRLTEYIKGLSERFQVVVLSAKTPDHPHIERYHGARLLRVPVGSGDLPSRSQTFDRAVRRQLESEEYGLVHFFDPFAGYALCERRGELGYRLIYDACTFPSVELPLEHPALEANRRFVARVRRQELFCLMNADGVVVGSPLTADYVAGLGVERDRVRVLRAPVDLEPFKPELMGRPDATPMKVLHLGRATRGQGLDTLLEAMHLALQTADMRLTVVSPKNPEAQGLLEARVTQLKLSGKVQFQDPVGHDDIFKVLATGDVGSLTLDDVERNRTVGTPLARLGEYLAAGRPVIAADLPSVRALFPMEGGLLYRAGDARSLADALVQLAIDTGRRIQMGAAARAAAGDWDSARVRLELFKLYADVTGANVEARQSGDAAPDPFEPTQLGAMPSSDSGEITQLGARVSGTEDSGIGTNKVKTDPAGVRPDSSTDANGRAQRPAVMGVLLHEEAGPATDPGARPASEPPVVLGAPLLEELSEDFDLIPEGDPVPTARPSPDSPGPRAPVASPPSAVRPAPSTSAVSPGAGPRTPLPAPAQVMFVPPLSSPPRSTVPTAWEPPRGQPLGEEPDEPSGVILIDAPGAFESLPTSPSMSPEGGVAAAGPRTVTRKTTPSGPKPAALPPTSAAAPAVPQASAPRPTIPAAASAPGAIPTAKAEATTIPSLPPVLSVSAPKEWSSPPVTAQASAPRAAPPAPSAPPPLPPSSLSGLKAKPADPPPHPSRPSAPPLAVPRSSPPSPRAPAPRSEAPDEEISEIAPDEVEDVVDEPAGAADAPDEIMESDEAIQAVETDPSPPASALDPWLAQLVHGYCPPESHLFDRHTPPTTMPGRDT